MKTSEQKREYSKRYYQDNKERLKAVSRKCSQAARDRNKAFIQDYLSNHPCVDCGNNNPIVLEFDHVRGQKLTNVSEMVAEHAPLERIKDEVSKCEVRCANCHRIVTHNRRSG